jgi:uncharacterized membrane protein (DUF4010 family)
MIELSEAFRQIGVALGLGLLVGLQRERVASRLAGLRTFALTTVFGTLCGQLSHAFGGWIAVAGLLALTGIILAGNAIKLRSEGADPGQTTEVALLLLYLVGVYLAVGPTEVAIAVGGGTAVLLWAKPQLQGFAGRLGDADVRAIMQFALLSLVILPVLPNRAIDLYGVVNPREAWWMVVLVAGLSLIGYVAHKLLGDRGGTLAAGLLGGLISSTATTLAFARRARTTPAATATAAIVIALASIVVFARVLVEIAITSPDLLRAATPRVGGLGLLAALLAVFLWVRWRRRDAGDGLPPLGNPTQIEAALFFGVLYAAVTFGGAAARDQFGDSGLYAVAAVSGLTDIDAITLSTARAVSSTKLGADEGWRLVVLAILTNLGFKFAAIVILGGRALALRAGTVIAITIAAGALLLLWG